MDYRKKSQKDSYISLKKNNLLIDFKLSLTNMEEKLNEYQ